MRVVASRTSPRAGTPRASSRTASASSPAAAGRGLPPTPRRARVLLLPVDPDASARAIAAGLRERLGVEVGVIVSDTLGRAWREGQTGCMRSAPAGVQVFEDLADGRMPRGACSWSPCRAWPTSSPQPPTSSRGRRHAPPGRRRARACRPGRLARPARGAIHRAPGSSGTCSTLGADESYAQGGCRRRR